MVLDHQVDGDVCRLTMYGGMPQAGEEWNMVFYLVYDSIISQDDLETLNDFAVWAGALWEVWRPACSMAFNWKGIRVYNMTQDRPVGEDAAPSPIPGQHETECSATQIAALALAPTGEKRVRGRKYLPGISEVLIAYSVLHNNAMVALTNVCAKWITPIKRALDNIWYPGLYRKLKPFIEITVAIAKSIAGIQRRRRPGQGA